MRSRHRPPPFAEPFRLDWATSRINYLIKIIGDVSWFKNKNILELGCAHGDIGETFLDMGAKVTFAEGRQEHVSVVSERLAHHILEGNCTVITLDQDQPWKAEKKYDLIIHWGVLYHLENWENDLITCLMSANHVCLETEVIDSDDPYEFKSRREDGYDQSIHGIGTHPSPANIERVLKENVASFVRYDDSELNSHYHHYDWVSKNDGSWKPGQRRFWMISTSEKWRQRKINEKQ